MAKTEDEVKAYVLRRLGSGIVDVELTDDQMGDVIDDTKRWFGFRLGQKRVIQIPLTTATNVYILEPDVTEVLQVFLPSAHFPAVDTDDFSYTYSLLFGQWRSPGASPMPYSDLVQRLQYLSMSKKIFSADREWNYNRDTRELLISGHRPSPIRPRGREFVPTVCSGSSQRVFRRNPKQVGQYAHGRRRQGAKRRKTA